MKIIFLRILILVQFVIAGFAISNGFWYLEWQQISPREIAISRDAAYAIKNLLSNWWFFKGASAGMTICVALMAVDQRKSIIDADRNLKIHWAVSVFPIFLVLWYGWNI
ncbi:hypothetical protein AAKU55_003257 [Oxalobacteraceae bacterium GrIS 1.11]